MNSGSMRPEDVVALPDADKQRMAQLYEEVQARLTEMSLVMSRNLGMTITRDTRLMLRPINVAASPIADPATASSNGIVEVHCTETPPGHFECGCYDYEAGTCGPC